MIKAKIYRKKEQLICGFQLSGHAGYAEEGADIVCSAVTILVFNTVNAIESLTDAGFTCETDEKKGGFIKVMLPDEKMGTTNHDAQLLLQAMVLGLKDIEKEYNSYIILNDEEV